MRSGASRVKPLAYIGCSASRCWTWTWTSMVMPVPHYVCDLQSPHGSQPPPFVECASIQTGECYTKASPKRLWQCCPSKLFSQENPEYQKTTWKRFGTGPSLHLGGVPGVGGACRQPSHLLFDCAFESGPNLAEHTCPCRRRATPRLSTQVLIQRETMGASSYLEFVLPRDCLRSSRFTEACRPN